MGQRFTIKFISTGCLHYYCQHCKGHCDLVHRPINDQVNQTDPHIIGMDTKFEGPRPNFYAPGNWRFVGGAFSVALVRLCVHLWFCPAVPLFVHIFFVRSVTPKLLKLKI